MSDTQVPAPLPALHGALLIDKHAGVTSFGVIELLQRQLRGRYGVKRRELPKIGHGGTLDPFATGLLIVCVGRGVKLARYFLGSSKAYEGELRFGETTVPGDPTAPISGHSEVFPDSLESLQRLAHQMTLHPYLQTPPMHSAKKLDGKPLYELARAGIEVEREAKICQLSDFEILSYEKPRASFRVKCSAGTYIRVLAQDFGRLLGTVAMLNSLRRIVSGHFSLARGAMSLDQIQAAIDQGQEWDELPCWIPFESMLEGYPRAEATEEETQEILNGRQNAIFNILRRAETNLSDPEASFCGIYCHHRLIAIAARNNESGWQLERVFVTGS